MFYPFRSERANMKRIISIIFVALFCVLKSYGTNSDVLTKIQENTGYIVKSDRPLSGKSFSYKFLFSNNNEYWYYTSPKLRSVKEKIFQTNPDIIEIYEDQVIWALSEPNDPMFKLQWGMKLIELQNTNSYIQEKWNKKAKMYICDSGPPADINGVITHEDLIKPLNKRYIVGNNYALVHNITEAGDTVVNPVINRNWDDIGHSTHVAGIAGAMSNNGIGVSGVDWVSEITFEKILRDGSGWGFTSWLMFSLLTADQESRSRKMDIIVNISAGGVVPYRPLEKLIAYLDETRNELGYGVLLVCAAGNHASESLLFPAAYSRTGFVNPAGYNNVISVGAVTLDSLETIRRARYSAYGNFVDIWAPGGTPSEIIYLNETYRVQWDLYSILSLAPDSVESRPFYPHWYNAEDYPYNYFRQVGTSMAAPHVSGAVCRLLDFAGANNNFISAAEIKEMLRNTGSAFKYKGLVEDKNGNKFEEGDEFIGYILNLKKLWELNKVLSSAESQDAVLKTFYVSQNFPNPFNSETVIEYYIPSESDVKFSVYNLLGEKILSEEYYNLQTGIHTLSFNASQLSSGIYLYSIIADDFSAMKKMQLLK